MTRLEDKTLLAVIPARGGSKGVPGKNIVSVSGRPLIAWTIDEALHAQCISKLILSSDDSDIINVAESYGCEVPFVRPAPLATDVATSMDVVMHALSELPSYKYVMLLQPTSPLRTANDIESAFNAMTRERAPACVSISLVNESPYWMYTIDLKGRLKSVVEAPTVVTRRQDLPPVYSINGAIYIADAAWLKRTRSFLSPETLGYIMPQRRSIDIDTFEDIRKTEEILNNSVFTSEKFGSDSGVG